MAIWASRKASRALLPVMLNSVLTQSVVDALICRTSAAPVRPVKSAGSHAAAAFAEGFLARPCFFGASWSSYASLRGTSRRSAGELGRRSPVLGPVAGARRGGLLRLRRGSAVPAGRDGCDAFDAVAAEGEFGCAWAGCASSARRPSPQLEPVAERHPHLGGRVWFSRWFSSHEGSGHAGFRDRWDGQGAARGCRHAVLSAGRNGIDARLGMSTPCVMYNGTGHTSQGRPVPEIHGPFHPIRGNGQSVSGK